MSRPCSYLWCSLFWCVLVTLVGCAPSPQETFDRAVKSLERAEARLDNLRPAYDAAREKAMLDVCREIAGTTPEESAMSALSQLQGAGGDALSGLIGGAEAAVEGVTGGASAAEGETAAEEAAKVKPLDADTAIDQLLAAQQEMKKQGAEATGKIAGAYAALAKIKTPGSPENKRFAEVFEAMPEVKSYRRQEERVEKAQAEVEEAEAALSAAGG